MEAKWRNDDLRRELILNTLEYLGRNRNVSIRELAEYTGQEYVLITYLMCDLESQGIIKSEKVFNLIDESD